jgi:hypothetical protein
MIDKASGEIRFLNWEIPLSPKMIRSEFLASSLVTGAKERIKNEPHRSWLLPIAKWEEWQWFVTVHFTGEALSMIRISVTSDEFGIGWSDWSEEGERKREVFHDDVLKKIFKRYPPYDFSWGRVSSSYDPKGGSSSIIVRYGQK